MAKHRKNFTQLCGKCHKMKKDCKHFICQDCLEPGDRIEDIVCDNKISKAEKDVFEEGKYERNKHFEYGRKFIERRKADVEERIDNERRRDWK